MYFHNEPRVTVAPSEVPYYVHTFGQNFVATSHGHKAKAKDIPILLASAYPKEWGGTSFRRCDLGHVHHSDSTEFPGMDIHYHPTLAPKDGYHAGRYDSKRQIQATVLHREFGPVHQVNVPIDYVHAVMGAKS